MKMRIYIAVSLFVLTGATLALGAASPPNVLIFLADDLGYGDLSCHGNPHVQTPELDRFAGDGVEMEHFNTKDTQLSLTTVIEKSNRE